MSASPSGQSNGPTPNGGTPQYIRRPRVKADPTLPRKKPGPSRRPPPNGASQSRTNGLAPQSRPVGTFPVNGTSIPRLHGQYPVQSSGAGMGGEIPIAHANGGWTHPPSGQYTDYPLMTTKRALREGLRYHIARFSSKKDVDPTNPDEFTRPVVLHRRDPKAPPPGKAFKDEDAMMLDAPMDSKEREKAEIAKAEKEAQKAADLAQIAPTGNNAAAVAQKKNQPFRNEKTTQVHRLDKTAEQKKASDLRYEEALPWHMEDADNKNTWVGTYEAALSDANVMFVIDGPVFRMIPAEKWYKFTPTGQFKAYTIEEAEAQMNKKTKESRWAMKTNEQKAEARALDEYRGILSKTMKVKSESSTFKNSGKSELQDMDELDFDADDLFQDDDEMATMEPENDEDAQEAKEKIKREQLAANVFDAKQTEAEVDKELKEEEKEAEEREKLGKDVKKALKKREKNWVYEDDDDGEPKYFEESEVDSSDDEKEKEAEQKKKDEEAKNKGKDPKALSVTSSKGTSTPSGRPKHTDALKKGKSLKRPGSPNLSESSGNESTRKKLKKNSHTAGSSTPNPGSRQSSPNPSQPGMGSRKSSVLQLKVPSDKVTNIQSTPPNPSPTAVTSEGEMAEGGKKRTSKIRQGSGSPNGSRSGTPAGGSRAGSPQASRAQSPQVSGSGKGPITSQEIVAALPASGIALKDLIHLFRDRIGESGALTKKTDFIMLVKKNAKYGTDKLMRAKQ